MHATSTRSNRTGVFWFDIAIVFIAACASAASLAWPFDAPFSPGLPIWWLQSLSLAVYVVVLHRCHSQRQAYLIAQFFAAVWLGATFWWLYVAMHTYGGLHSALAVVAIASLAAALGIYYALAGAVYWYLSKSNALRASLAFAALWTMAELARGTWLTGFGWGAVAYAHTDGPLSGFAPWVGSYGVVGIAAWVAASLALAWKASWLHRVATLACLALGAFLAIHPLSWSSSNGLLSVTLLQGNIPQDEKFETGSGVPLALQWYGDQLIASTGSLVVAPETAVPLLPQELPEGYWDALTQRFSQGNQAALVGIPLGNNGQGYTNSVVGLRPDQVALWRYDKHHLVPFGEFIPPLFKWFTRMMNIPLGDFNRGEMGQASFAWSGQRLASHICYEDLFGEELGARFIDASLSPTVFVNVSNIGWFGDTVAIDQHLQISRMRALEFERPFVRATNTGATVIMDHRAQITSALPRHIRSVLEGQVEGRTGLTPYAWWVSRWGLWPLWLVALAVVVWVRQKMLSK